MQKPELVIFDCDGVLVDSEHLASKIEAKLLTDAGVSITHEEIAERYSGLTWKEILLDVEKTAGVPLSAGLLDMADRLVDMALERELDMIEDADRARDFYENTLGLKIGSNGAHGSIRWMEFDLPGGGCLALTNATGQKPGGGGMIALEVSDLDAVIGFEGISVARPVTWYEQPDDPTTLWPEHVIGNVIGPQSLDVGDLDGDGDVDVVVGEHNLSDPTTGRVLVFENSAGSWQQHLVATGHEHHDGTQLFDSDGDGDLDIVSIGWGHGNVLLYEQIGC